MFFLFVQRPERYGVTIDAFTAVTFVSDGQRAVEVLLLQSPCGVVHFVGDPTRALAVHLDGCGERRERKESIDRLERFAALLVLSDRQRNADTANAYHTFWETVALVHLTSCFLWR